MRVATVKTPTGKLIRPVKGLVPLEIRSSEVKSLMQTFKVKKLRSSLMKIQIQNRDEPTIEQQEVGDR